MKLTLLGTGTPAPSTKRQSSGYLVEIGERDDRAGPRPRRASAADRGRLSAHDVTHALFTHLHYDHCMDYARLVLQRWDIGAGKVADLLVYGPPPLKRMTASLFGAGGVYRRRTCGPGRNHRGKPRRVSGAGGKLPRKPPGPMVTEVKPGDPIEGDGGARRSGRARTCSRFCSATATASKATASSLCYAGDSGGVCETVIALAKKADILIHMMHLASGNRAERAIPEEQRRAHGRRRGWRGAPRSARWCSATSHRRSTRPARASA